VSDVAERTLEVQKSVTETQTVLVCDHCGLEIEDDDGHTRLAENPRVVESRSGTSRIVATRDGDSTNVASRASGRLRFGDTFDLHEDCREEVLGGVDDG
jgi:hypothetical protein